MLGCSRLWCRLDALVPQRLASRVFPSCFFVPPPPMRVHHYCLWRIQSCTCVPVQECSMRCPLPKQQHSTLFCTFYMLKHFIQRRNLRTFCQIVRRISIHIVHFCCFHDGVAVIGVRSSPAGWLNARALPAIANLAVVHVQPFTSLGVARGAGP